MLKIRRISAPILLLVALPCRGFDLEVQSGGASGSTGSVSSDKAEPAVSTETVGTSLRADDCLAGDPKLTEGTKPVIGKQIGRSVLEI